jgi:hypothetical protein
LLTATLLAATALLSTLFFALALLALTFLSIAISLLASLFSVGGRFAGFVRIALWFHSSFPLLLTSDWPYRGLRWDPVLL